MPATALPTVAPTTGRKEHTRPETRTQPPYNVVLINDEDHTYQYVIEMLHSIFGHPIELGFLMALEVDSVGRSIVFTTHLERAELERDRIHAYGADPRIPQCKGSMSAVLEPSW